MYATVECERVSGVVGGSLVIAMDSYPCNLA